MSISLKSQKPIEQASSTQGSQNDESNNKEEAYFLILSPSEKKIHFTGLNYETKYKIEPKIIYQKRIDKGNETYLEEIVFKFKKKLKKKKKKEKKNQLNLLKLNLLNTQ